MFKALIDPFLIALVGVVLLALVWPVPGISGGVLHFELVTTYGVGVVFFLYGLTLAPERLRAGIARWPVHLVVQFGTFVLFPLTVLLAGFAVRRFAPYGIWLGFLYVAALPSTISSSVAMTSLARGNVPIAVFNASLSSLLGVFLTPLLMAWFIQANGGSMALGPVIFKIALLVLAPILAGQLARRWLASWAARNSSTLKLADRAVILAIVYNSFCDSVGQGIWARLSPTVLLGVLAGVIGLFFLIYWLMNLACDWCGFSHDETIACTFCGSKKSLASGVPLARVIFGAHAAIGILITPLILYHFCQLVIVSVIASAHGRRDAELTRSLVRTVD